MKNYSLELFIRYSINLEILKLIQLKKKKTKLNIGIFSIHTQNIITHVIGYLEGDLKSLRA